jgi:hypothetical protein
MTRRDFITLLGAAAVWPLVARAQQQPAPVIGYLSARSPDDTWHLVEAFRRGLREGGFVEGQNATIEYRWGLGERERLAELASDLVRKRVSVLVTTGGEGAALAAKTATVGHFRRPIDGASRTPMGTRSDQREWRASVCPADCLRQHPQGATVLQNRGGHGVQGHQMGGSIKIS